MNGKFLFDTNSIVYYLQGRQEWVEFIDHQDLTIRFVSVITRMELLAYPGISPSEEERIQRFLSDVFVVPLGDGIEATAIAIRRAKRLKLPDAIIAATSIFLTATLLTNDLHLTELIWPGYQTLGPN